jgi:MSHA biogenesis protein MshO
LNNFAAINAVGGTDQDDCLNGNVHCMVVYNTGQLGADAYAGDNIAAITAKAAGSLSFDLGPIVDRFPNKSPRQRFFVVDTPVRFDCNLGTGEIRRHDGYTIGGAPGGAGNLLVDQVIACSFTYNPGTNTRSGLVTISITISDATLGQSVTLQQQAHVDNQP